MVRTTRRLLLGLLLVAAACRHFAQQTTGTISGRVLDEQGTAMPGVTVTATNPQHRVHPQRRSPTTKASIVLPALPVGTYDLTVELLGLHHRSKRKAVVVNVGQTLDAQLRSEGRAASRRTSPSAASTPLIETSSSSVGGVVDIGRIESLPLNGRQFANLAATIPGVGLGFHSDPTKSTQYSPQIGGGNGRNVNYQIDGGDNNDDTVGGLLQLFPLEAIQEFNFVTSRYKAEYGRSNGGVMNIVTKSGTNELHGSGFTLFRDDSMNAKTETEKLDERRQAGLPPVSVRRIVRRADPAQQRALLRRARADAAGHVPGRSTRAACSPPRTASSRRRIARISFTGEGNDESHADALPGGALRPQQQLAAVRRRSARRRPTTGATSKNTFNSINANHNWVLGGTMLNEFIFQYADFANGISAPTAWIRTQLFPNGVAIGQNANTPQQTRAEEVAVPQRLLLARRRGMGGIGHDFKTGVNFIHEPQPVHHVQQRHGRLRLSRT